MTNKSTKPVLAVVSDAKKPKPTKKTGSGSGSGKSDNKKFGEYEIINGAFHQIKAVRSGGDESGYVEFPLCDFTCKIIEEVTHDTGLDDQAFLRIDGVRNDGFKLPAIEVPTIKFYSTQANWVNEFYGTAAFVYPGAAKRDNLRAAIHLYSKLDGDVPKKQVYEYTGWKKINEQWHYLSGSGSISANGLSDDLQVDLGHGHMARYKLPPPLDREQLKGMASSVQDLMQICPGKMHIGTALLCAIARAPLGECQPTDFAIFIHGLTGTGKSAISAIALAFFGDFNERAFPANFSDTSNDMEAKAFQAKDTIMIFDDFKPSVSLSEASKVHAKAERLIRNTGNQAGRGRRGVDMKARAAPYNRSMTLISGEDLPKGQSLLARLLTLQLITGDVDDEALARLKKASGLGELSGVMSAYLKWLAPRMDDLKKQFPKDVDMLCAAAKRDGYASSHSRAPGIYSNLIAGMEIFIDFLLDFELISNEQGNAMLHDAETHLKSALGEQGAYQIEQDEAVRFLELLRACFSSGNAHIACRLNQGPPPRRPHAWGWRNDAALGSSKPMGDCIGWYCDKEREVWLEKNAAFAAVQRFAKMQGDAFLLSPASLWRRLHEKCYVLKTEARKSGAPQLSVKRIIGDRSRRVLILSADVVESE